MIFNESVTERVFATESDWGAFALVEHHQKRLTASRVSELEEALLDATSISFRILVLFLHRVYTHPLDRSPILGWDFGISPFEQVNRTLVAPILISSLFVQNEAIRRWLAPSVVFRWVGHAHRWWKLHEQTKQIGFRAVNGDAPPLDLGPLLEWKLAVEKSMPAVIELTEQLSRARHAKLLTEDAALARLPPDSPLRSVVVAIGADIPEWISWDNFAETRP